MDVSFSSLPLEVQDQHVLRAQAVLAIPDVHADAVDHVVAVRLDEELLLPLFREQCQEGAELRLGPGMEVHLGLLEEKRGALCGKDTVHYDREDLADAISNVDEVRRNAVDGDTNLKRSPFLVERLDFDFLEQSGSTTKAADGFR